MSRDARKKLKHRLKRKQKQTQARKAASVTPLDRIARSGGILECYVNADWRESGMASLQVLGQAADGRCAHAAFLIDVWCVGLKDAFGSRTALRTEFNELLDRMGEMLDVVPIPPAEARRLVAGGVRFSRRNGFHLPPHVDRWTAIFGGLGDTAFADLDGFGVDGDAGALRYIGTREFLRRRLAACTPDEFLARADVEWVMGDGTPRSLADEDDFAYEDDHDHEAEAGPAADAGDDDPDAFDSEGDARLLAELAKTIGGAADQTEDAVRKWCFQTGRAPHPRLREAVNTLLVSTLPMAIEREAMEQNLAVAAKGDDADVPVLPDPLELIELGLNDMPENERRAVAEAMDQVHEYMRQSTTPDSLFAALHGPPGDAARDQPPA